MNLLCESGLEMQNFMQSQEWEFCFIGGLAVIRWGEIRMTQDIDMSLSVDFGNEEMYLKILLKHFRSRIADAFEFALNNRVLLLTASNNVPVDIAMAGFPFEKEMIQRGSLFLFQPACSLMTCSAEDLIILKAFANRYKDWSDIESIIDKQGNTIDVNYINERLFPLCELKEEPEIMDRLNNLLAI
jgi:hypothetical protein